MRWRRRGRTPRTTCNSGYWRLTTPHCLHMSSVTIRRWLTQSLIAPVRREHVGTNGGDPQKFGSLTRQIHLALPVGSKHGVRQSPKGPARLKHILVGMDDSEPANEAVAGDRDRFAVQRHGKVSNLIGSFAESLFLGAIGPGIGEEVGVGEERLSNLGHHFPVFKDRLEDESNYDLAHHQ